MEKFRGIVVLLALATTPTVTILPCRAEGKNEEDAGILRGDDQTDQRQRGRWELTDEECNRLLEAVKKNDAKKAEEIARLRKKSPDKFREELRLNSREEYDKIRLERLDRWWEKRRQDWRAEFIDWLTKNVTDVASELASLKDDDPNLYARKYELALRRYRRAFDESRDDPEMAKILLEDLRLQDRRDYLVGKIKRAKSEQEKERLVAQLQRVLSDRYDLIVILKERAYERLLRRLERVQKDIKKSRDEIEEAKKKQIKDENIRQRTKTLLEGEKKGIL